jgi:hypothetical protein
VALLVAALSLTPAAPADAVAGFGPPQSVPGMNGHCRLETLSPGTSLRGFGTCDHVDANGNQQHDLLAYFEGSADGWHGRRLTLLGRPIAARQDGTATLLLFESHDMQGNRQAAVLRRDQQGRYSWRPLNAPDYVGGGGIVARAGKWWAVWACVRGGGREYSLCESGTMFGPTATRQIDATQAGDALPSLALRSDGQLKLMWTRIHQTTSGADEEIRIATSSGRGWTSRTLVTATDQDIYGQLVTDGNDSFAAWVQGGRPFVASDESGAWRIHAFQTRSCASSVSAAASAGSVLLVVNQCATGDYDNHAAGSAVMALERRGGVWTSTTLASSTGRSTAGVGASDAGRATVVFANTPTHNGYSRTQ